ncbi:hypothetical protein P3719_23295 [Vibrio parahaemolyticus]|nr:hypothetical protein [Vibrio parahaemolyticus]MCA6691464.1 hypothetical protein [Vibrio parahaemolyticus]MDF5585803.1 hypothetical protein [Vibrio parahaemolyticus]MDF5590994.1 hypothetical protein [Vibrio parahaemolyticus]MDG2871714.1 hypothetical protein [Vibrio parahaemolyticus]
MNLDEAKNGYLAKSIEILNATESLSKDKYGIFEIFTNKKLNDAKEQLSIYYSWLREFDATYSGEFMLHGTIPDITMLNGNLSIVERSRSMFVSSLNSYEKALANIESSTNFKLTTSIALIALLVAVLGLVIT